MQIPQVQIPQVQIPFPILVCDIGGTNVRSSFVEAPGGALEALPARRTADFPGLAEAALGAPLALAREPGSN